MHRVILAMLLMLAVGYGCAAQSQNQDTSEAKTTTAAAGADRQGHFARSADDMSTCVGLGSHERHPELQFDLNVSPPQTVSAKKYQSDETAIWVAEFHAAGATESDVFLRNVSATTSDLDEVWRIVALCAKS